ncbi:MAG TPA: phospholipid carrier-dependent glycosyltransferase [Terracidiphilus sp.]
MSGHVPRESDLLKGAYSRWAYAAWLLVILVFAGLHFVHLSADFPNHSPWMEDWAKYTDEGWYGNAAIRAHLFGHWYLPQDFNPAPAVPVWPFLEWIVFFFTGVSIVAARALSVSFFLLELILGYLFLRVRGSRWMALLAMTLVVTSPFLYSFSRLAILEPMLVTFLLAGLNLALRLPRFRRPVAISALVGVLFTLMLLTKTTAVFLLPALGWTIVASLWPDWRKALRCCLAAALGAAVSFGAWMATVVHAGLLADYKYLFFINTYTKPTEWYWPVLSFWWALHGGFWADRLLMPVVALVLLATAAAFRWRWSRSLWLNPAFGASVLAVAGYLLFMTYQNHPQARYFVVIALFSFFALAMAAEALLTGFRGAASQQGPAIWRTAPGAVVIAASSLIAAFNGILTLEYIAHPEYTFVTAARDLVHYMDQHPNGNRILVSVSGDEISMITQVRSLCDDFGTVPLPDKLAHYQPGWWATWNDIDPGTLEDLHLHFSLEQVASFRAFDHPDRNELVLFKLHPLASEREDTPALQEPQPDDKIDIPVQ